MGWAGARGHSFDLTRQLLGEGRRTIQTRARVARSPGLVVTPKKPRRSEASISPPKRPKLEAPPLKTEFLAVKREPPPFDEESDNGAEASDPRSGVGADTQQIEASSAGAAIDTPAASACTVAVATASEAPTTPKLRGYIETVAAAALVPVASAPATVAAATASEAPTTPKLRGFIEPATAADTPTLAVPVASAPAAVAPAAVPAAALAEPILAVPAAAALAAVAPAAAAPAAAAPAAAAPPAAPPPAAAPAAAALAAAAPVAAAAPMFDQVARMAIGCRTTRTGVCGIELSRSGRSFCKFCSAVIKMSEVRYLYWYVKNKPPGYIHAGCLVGLALSAAELRENLSSLSPAEPILRQAVCDALAALNARAF